MSMPNVTISSLDIHRHYDDALATLRGVFGVINVEEPEAEGLAKRTSGLISRLSKDFFRIQLKVFERNFPGQDRAEKFINHLESLGIGARFGTQEVKQWANMTSRPYIFIDAASLIAYMANPDCVERKPLAAVLSEALAETAELRQIVRDERVSPGAIANLPCPQPTGSVETADDGIVVRPAQWASRQAATPAPQAGGAAAAEGDDEGLPKGVASFRQALKKREAARTGGHEA